MERSTPPSPWVITHFASVHISFRGRAFKRRPLCFFLHVHITRAQTRSPMVLQLLPRTNHVTRVDDAGHESCHEVEG